MALPLFILKNTASVKTMAGGKKGRSVVPGNKIGMRPKKTEFLLNNDFINESQ